ncbi:sensor histidine kinase [Tumebacillus sp. DT12]|uniref:histidine kinase n=1 Tax=Tumebacillus lacus TaxID=2995335 RepID=A0ABT3X2V1_9BACL|nr:sensor histidine kinase [Tumebacillus lacus]MCX7571229.1 sensor histidine kinase [Tumebacillus lacus]
MLTNLRDWHWSNWLFYMIRLSWFLGHWVIFTELLPQVSSGALFRLAQVLCFLLPLLFWRPGATHRTLFVWTEALTSGLFAVYVNGVLDAHSTFLILPLTLVGFLSVQRMVWWVAPLFVLVLPALGPLLGLQSWHGVWEMMVGGQVAFLIGYAFSRVLSSHEQMRTLLHENQRQYQLIEEQNQALMQYAQQVEQVTLLEERNRMARELHDTVGHTLTSVIMGMDAVMYLVDSVPEKAKEKLEVLRDVTRGGLDEVRRNIHQIAPTEEERLGHTLAAIAGEFAVHTATKISLYTEGEEYEVATPVRLTLIRCLQESLTNAKRHGRAMTVLIRLCYGPDSVQLRIEDDGIGMADSLFGFGLRTMQERIAAHQGTLDVVSRAGEGAVVTCTIPTGGEL